MYLIELETIDVSNTEIGYVKSLKTGAPYLFMTYIDAVNWCVDQGYEYRGSEELNDKEKIYIYKAPDNVIKELNKNMDYYSYIIMITARIIPVKRFDPKLDS